MLDEILPEVLAKELAEKQARDAKRLQEKLELERKLQDERDAEELRQKEEKARRVEEARRKRSMEEEWKKLGSDKIEDLGPVPPSCVDDSLPGAMKAWVLDVETSKPELTTNSLKPGYTEGETSDVTLAKLKELGLIYFKVNLSEFNVVNQIVQERCYKHTDEIHVSQTSKDEQFLEKAFQEHYNDDEQIRLVVDGSFFMDIRPKDDNGWIRCHVCAGDLLVIPPGLYHRVTLDENDYAAMFRVFKESPRWAPLFRSDKRTESNSVRVQYLQMLKRGDIAENMQFK